MDQRTDAAFVERFWSRVCPEPNTGCWLWTGPPTSGGYGQIGWREHTYRAHRVSWMLVHGANLNEDAFVCHRCDTPLCVNPDHLFVGTHSDNMADMIAKGRRVQARGRAIGIAKLTEEMVREARRRFARGEKFTEIADDFGCSSNTVCAACVGRTWRHVGDQAA